MENKMMIKYGIAAAVILIGIAFETAGIGEKDFLGFGSVGTWLLFIGMVMVISTAIRGKKERKVDERMLHVAAKANRITFICIIVAAFIVMIIDGIRPIAVPYHLSMSYLVCGIMIAYLVSYRLLLRFN